MPGSDRQALQLLPLVLAGLAALAVYIALCVLLNERVLRPRLASASASAAGARADPSSPLLGGAPKGGAVGGLSGDVLVAAAYVGEALLALLILLLILLAATGKLHAAPASSAPRAAGPPRETTGQQVAAFDAALLAAKPQRPPAPSPPPPPPPPGNWLDGARPRNARAACSRSRSSPPDARRSHVRLNASSQRPRPCTRQHNACSADERQRATKRRVYYNTTLGVAVSHSAGGMHP